MKTTQLIATVLTCSFLYIQPARAQFVVSDPATEAETLATALATAEESHSDYSDGYDVDVGLRRYWTTDFAQPEKSVSFNEGPRQ